MIEILFATFLGLLLGICIFGTIDVMAQIKKNDKIDRHE
jgi:uncharacterized membrane protein YraQ (UPF0718 family)